MKTLLMIAMLIIVVSTQTITPKTQACVCSNLMNQLDCQALNGCQWTPSNSTNSTNTATTALTGTCANATTNTTTPIVLTPTFCGSITNGTTCAGQVGCAYLNSTCQIFTGCSAYVKTTHSDCQLISTQCTTDGTQCALPAACSTYTTEAICVGSQGITTKNCKWTPAAGTATTGTCSDTTCADAPTTLTTLAQCQTYISTCFSTGKGCASTLASCTTYLTTEGCSARIGLEGKCIDTTPASTNCRAQVCTDATLATASSCATFLSSSTCLFNGKGCVASPLPACNTYLVSQSCESMIGSDGKCTTDKNSSTNCKLYTCTDAPTSTISDSDCQKIASTCVTNGQGCVTSPLQQCSTYTGTTSTPCTQFKGINGICKASTTAQCTERTCLDDAAKTFTTDAQCDSYFKGCITKGVGCVATKSPCENYTGTAEECGKLIGTSGNCTFSTDGQAAGTSCRTKACTDSAASTLKSNAECSAYSFQCASNNGVGCIEPGNCDTINQKELCQWKSTCSYNQICLDRSTCANYSKQTLCIFNTQQYLPIQGTTYYERPCTWSGSTCTDQICPTTSSLKTDDACQVALAGCLTNGAGCIDISADCTKYRGLVADCEKFKGVNQTTQCTQDRTVSDANTACIVKNCANAKLFNGSQSSGTNVCSTFTGCQFDGKDNCTNLGCTSYFGNQNTCKNIANAVDGSNKKQYCWNTSVAQSTAQCTVRQCTEAPETSIDDSTCNTFLPGCVTNGKGCVDPSTECTSYPWQPIDICSKFYSDGKQCTGSSICIPRTCSDTIPNPDSDKCAAYLNTCLFDGSGCIAKGQCSSYNPKDNSEQGQASRCNNLKDDTGQACGFQTGATKCSVRQCSDYMPTSIVHDEFCKFYLPICQFKSGRLCQGIETRACDSYTPTGSLDNEKASSCQSFLDTSGKNCGYKAEASKCSAKSCTDVFIKTNDASCKSYLKTCYLSAANTCSATQTGACNQYTPNGSTDSDKAASCQIQLDTEGIACGFKTEASKCSAKSCTDIITAANDEACKAYLPNCYFISSNTCGSGATCDSYTATGANNATKATFCNSQNDFTGAACGFQAGASKCSPKACNDVFTATDDFSCNTYLSSCKINPNKNCLVKGCKDAQPTLKTDAECAAYRKGCVTNGGGCLDSAVHNCADYKGDRTTCQKFTGLDGPCTNAASAGATTSCTVRQCGDNNNETSQAACDSWYPPLANGTKKCIWNGSTGCIALTTCDQINGTVDTCALVQASDSPCSGTAILLPSTTKCISNKTICNKAPTSFITDAQCKKWHKECLSTGFGCISDSADFCKSIISPTLCSSYKKDQSCGLANQCLTKPEFCSDLKSAFECNNTILTGTTVTCGWNAAANTTPICISLTCELLPATLTTDSACSAALTLSNKICTTNGAGCLTKTICSGYTYVSACNTALTSDGKKCIWSSSVCRNIVCTDNTKAKSDTECDTYLKGCTTTGAGCFSPFDCTTLNTAALCLKDSAGNPCLWYRPSTSANASCFRYSQCTDILQTTHAACQQLSPLCTTDGTKCIAITGCAKTSLQVSCVVGTDGVCGYLPASGTTPAICAPFTNCEVATGGTTFAACQAWGTTCVSNGTSCIQKTACKEYLTEAACGNLGISGTSTQKCMFSSNTCRPQVCTDATATSVIAIATHAGCAAFPALTPCTTNGTNGCIELSNCSSYSQILSGACVQGTDGPCQFQTTTTEATSTTSTTPASTTTTCRLKQCQDILGTTSASCATEIIGIGSKCVSNGVNCIAQSTCSTYTARESCLGGGSDGNCAFTPGTNTTTPNIGTCQLFTACNQANQDQTACNLKSSSCYFTPAPTNGTSSCSAHNCTTKAIGSSCQAVPNFDLSQYQICVLAAGTTTCQPGAPAAFSQSSCFTLTLSTHTWNPTTSQCQSCQAATIPNTTNTIDNLIITHGYLVSLLIAIAFMI